MSSETGDQRPVRLSTMASRPSEPEHLPCPRCDSTNTKFCYYNNYNFSQPRHFCKSCRRYWTRGGTLRNVPVGGSSRKNSSSSSSTSSSSSSSSHKRPRTATTAAGISPGAAATTAAPGSSSSASSDHHDLLRGNPVSAMVSQMVSWTVPMSVGSFMGCDVNLNEAVPEASNYGSLLTSQVGAAGLLPFGAGFGLGLGPSLHGVGFGIGPLDWPLDPIAHHGGATGNIGVGGGGGAGGGGNGSSSVGCNTWQMSGGGGGVEGGLGESGDCFGWPELAISMPGKRP